jgi:hypothetical protein
MVNLEFTENWNGKLFNDVFTDIRPHNPDIFFVGNEMEVMENSIYHGIAEVVAVRQLPFHKINDVIAFANMGRAAAYQAELLKRSFTKSQIAENEMLLDYIAFSYTERNIETQSELMSHWWETKNPVNGTID